MPPIIIKANVNDACCQSFIYIPPIFNIIHIITYLITKL